jgi:hypothetical protein
MFLIKVPIPVLSGKPNALKPSSYFALLPGLTLKNSTFFSESVLRCFVIISEQTAIISLYRIDSLLFITEMECI